MSGVAKALRVPPGGAVRGEPKVHHVGGHRGDPRCVASRTHPRSAPRWPCSRPTSPRSSTPSVPATAVEGEGEPLAVTRGSDAERGSLPLQQRRPVHRRPFAQQVRRARRAVTAATTESQPTGAAATTRRFGRRGRRVKDREQPGAPHALAHRSGMDRHRLSGRADVSVGFDPREDAHCKPTPFLGVQLEQPCHSRVGEAGVVAQVLS